MARAIVSGATLRQAKLTRLSARGAVFKDVDLTGADFTGAELRESRLSESCLDGADLREARLPETTISWKALRRARFTPESLVGAVLVGSVPRDHGAPALEAGRIDEERARILCGLQENAAETA
jgi:uncharacterized protein YjbI with pentapeptide repeats